MSGLRIGSLCSGFGGLDGAVQYLLGGELAFVADNDPGASKILAYRFPGVPNLGDITTVDWSQVEPVDVLCAGFPCQDISYAGQGKGIQEGNRSGLWYVIADAIGVLRPRLVCLENVAALVARRPGLDVVLASLAEFGLDAQWRCLRASDVGACHGRNRWFAIAYPGRDARAEDDAHQRLAAGRGGTLAAYPVGGELQRRGVAGVLAGEERAAAGARHQRERDGDAAGGSGPAPQDTHSATSGERRLPAPGQAEGGRARADAGGPGGAPAADADDSGRRRRPPGEGRREVWRDAAPGSGGSRGGGEASADAEGDGWHQGRTEPAGIVGRPDAPVRGDAPADADGGRLEDGAQLDSDPAPDPADGCPCGRHPDGHTPADADGRGRDGLHERQQPGHVAADAGQRGPGIRAGAAPGETDWGIYEAAVRRWEAILGRGAPPPTVPGRGGKPRLNPALPEWMMGLPEGWVIDVPGLSRNDMLRACGNGVVPQQAIAAYSMLLPAWLDAVRSGEAA